MIKELENVKDITSIAVLGSIAILISSILLQVDPILLDVRITLISSILFVGAGALIVLASITSLWRLINNKIGNRRPHLLEGLILMGLTIFEIGIALFLFILILQGIILPLIS